MWPPSEVYKCPILKLAYALNNISQFELGKIMTE